MAVDTHTDIQVVRQRIHDILEDAERDLPPRAVAELDVHRAGDVEDDLEIARRRLVALLLDDLQRARRLGAVGAGEADHGPHGVRVPRRLLARGVHCSPGAVVQRLGIVDLVAEQEIHATLEHVAVNADAGLLESIEHLAGCNGVRAGGGGSFPPAAVRLLFGCERLDDGPRRALLVGRAVMHQRDDLEDLVLSGLRLVRSDPGQRAFGCRNFVRILRTFRGPLDRDQIIGRGHELALDDRGMDLVNRERTVIQLPGKQAIRHLTVEAPVGIGVLAIAVHSKNLIGIGRTHRSESRRRVRRAPPGAP